MKVTLRQREKRNSISLYLDYYGQGQRKLEYLNLYLTPEPEKGKLTKEQKEENRKTLALAEAIRSKRHLEIQNGIHGFQDQSRVKCSFIAYMEKMAANREHSKGNWGNWDSMIKHLRTFAPQDVTFTQINKQWLESLKEYLQTAKHSHAQKPLSQSTQHSYYNKVRAALREAHREGIIMRNPAQDTEAIKPGDNQREFLTYDELRAAAKAECEMPILKTAFLFSALTGLRYSDIEKLTWSEVQESAELGHYIRFRQKKTKGTETLPISEDAYKLLGTRGKEAEKVFEGLYYSAWNNIKLQDWIKSAGITKPITFHCARHTYATLQLTLGTDLFTVSKLLGHKDVKTTQIYAKIIDEKKTAAAKLIKLEM